MSTCLQVACPDQLWDTYMIAAIKYLANAGFIKLSDAADFDAREIVKYHATAKPIFESGKVQL